MREVVFIKKNKEKWQEYEKILQQGNAVKNSEITSIYLDITDDLAYANTYYPHSKTTEYLHQLAGIAHRKIYKTKKESANSIKRFYLDSFPRMFYPYRKYLIYAWIFFILFAIIGAFSAAKDGEYVRLIMGDNYVDMTIENIKKGDPMAVYKSGGETASFLAITINNIKVALNSFIYGLLLGIGTLYMLIRNAVMLGSFQYFFYKYGVFWESVRTIWIHGTIEIFSIVVAITAGWVLASGILIPGTYTRKESFIRRAKDGTKIMLSTIPFFIIAGFFEGFVTRHTEMPVILSILIILGSLLLMIYYYFILPEKLTKKHKNYE